MVSHRLNRDPLDPMANNAFGGLTSRVVGLLVTPTA
jgi:hypothetical protein